ncbi:RluA family pseudouridine synthase [Simiduia aestuariiviva]|uniref:Pseudouridine synthase n=1 Tax=Simiduia aestuariiviva TaxID=1510459 RepID=A0A839UU08_9GAMM|nr:RluA family pseudouridine synthase [Simiduia aestuariiviva]MBB3168845.1 23S rRNA pseudouridine1911/1915/1917 synthase [Simiduia aestuariiviva]
MSQKLTVLSSSTLLLYLAEHLPDWSRNTLKQRLKAGCICVNGQVVKRHDFAIDADDRVEIHAAPVTQAVQQQRQRAEGLEILFADAELIAINKPAGLLSVASADENTHHALALLRQQLRRQQRELNLWPVHRLDRDTSGVLLFATSKAAREAVMAQWQHTEKSYLALVQGRPQPPAGTIDQPLRQDDTKYQMHVGPHPQAKSALTHYETVRAVGSQTLLKVRIETGRQHQIRAHLAWLGHPVVGDERYGHGGKNLYLHAERLILRHPVTGTKLQIVAPPSRVFLQLEK